MRYVKGQPLCRNNKSLRPDKLCKLHRLFDSKSWPIIDGVERSLFSKFCKMLEILNETQQDFIISLTYDFIWIKGSEYDHILVDVVKHAKNAIGDKTIYFVPCKPKEDFVKVKSSDYVWYTLRDNIFRFETDLGRFEMKNNFEEVNEDELLAGNAVVVLVDDFVGSGGTCRKAIGDLRQSLKRLKDNSAVKVLTLVAQQEGIKQMDAAGIEVFYGRVAPQAIKESNKSDDEKYRSYVLMDQIEARIPNFDKKYKYGYNESEALVSMIRCPNNTFPIYWYIPNVSPYERIQ